MSLLQEHDLSVRSIAFDAPHGADTKRIAYVRLTPPALSWRSNGAEPMVIYLPKPSPATSNSAFLGSSAQRCCPADDSHLFLSVCMCICISSQLNTYNVMPIAAC